MGNGVGGYGFHQLLKALTKLKDYASRSPPSGQDEGVPMSGSSSSPTIPFPVVSPGTRSCWMPSCFSGSWKLGSACI